MEQATGKTLKCIIVTPEKAVLDAPADFVALPMIDGELGVLPGRAPLIGRMGLGELRLQHENHTDRYFIDGGFAQVRNDEVTVLTARAIKGQEIDPDSADRALEAALAPATTPQAQEAQFKAQARARGMKRVALRARGAGGEAAH